MKLDISDYSLPVYEALASKPRLAIIRLLSKQKMNIKDIAKELGLSSAIITKHISKLEKAGLIKTERLPGKSGIQKISILKVDSIEIDFPQKIYFAYESYDSFISIGHFTDYLAVPTCGLATTSKFIGEVDEPKYFLNPDRVNAGIIWFTQGFLEYKTPNILKEEDSLEMIDISLEISSEFPAVNNVWPSDITFSLNDVELGTWTSPGDFGDTKGKYSPEWWPQDINQYGILTTIRITKTGVWINGKQTLGLVLDDFKHERSVWSFKIEVKDDAENVGGCTLFGKGFGNHDQDIDFKLYYS